MIYQERSIKGSLVLRNVGMMVILLYKLSMIMSSFDKMTRRTNSTKSHKTMCNDWS